MHEGATCSAPGCDSPCAMDINDLHLCLALLHIDWGIAHASEGARLAMQRLEEVAAGRRAAQRTIDNVRLIVEASLRNAHHDLRDAANRTRDIDPALADSCDAVALQAEDLLRCAGARLVLDRSS